MGRLGRLWILALCGYSLLRALLAWPLLVHYGVNPAVFLVLDVATAYPLALGQVRIVGGFRGRDYAAVQGWSVVAGGAFLLPYAYLLVAGHARMPVEMTGGVVALVSVLAAASVLRVRRECLVGDELVLEVAVADEH